MRGTESFFKAILVRPRITPACAGNSSYCRYSRGGGEDHPRVCGEQWSSAAALRCLLGSPPRVRGTGAVVYARVHGLRITPACAGNRGLSPRFKLPDRDHPRVCGEQVEPRPPLSTNWGSPPRVRGTAPSSRCFPPKPRITPACAGNSKFLLFRYPS